MTHGSGASHGKYGRDDVTSHLPVLENMITFRNIWNKHDHVSVIENIQNIGEKHWPTVDQLLLPNNTQIAKHCTPSLAIVYTVSVVSLIRSCSALHSLWHKHHLSATSRLHTQQHVTTCPSSKISRMTLSSETMLLPLGPTWYLLPTKVWLPLPKFKNWL